METVKIQMNSDYYDDDFEESYTNIEEFREVLMHLGQVLKRKKSKV